RTKGLAWWIPKAVIVAGLFIAPLARTGMWIVALVWMGTACILNSRRCGRTHCRYTGPYYLAMIAPVLVLASGVIPVDFYGWLLLAGFFLCGRTIIFLGTERGGGEIFLLRDLWLTAFGFVSRPRFSAPSVIRLFFCAFSFAVQFVRAVVSRCSKAARIAHPSTGRVSSTQPAIKRSSALHIERIERILPSSCPFFAIARLRTSPQRAASRPRKTRSSRISASVKPHCWACLMKRKRRAESLS